MAKPRKKRAAHVRKVARRRRAPSQAYTRRLEMLTVAGWPEADAKKEARSFASWHARRGRRKPGGIRLASLHYTRHTRRRRNPAAVAGLKRRRARLQVAAARRIDVGWKRGQTPAEIKRTADRIRALERADKLLQRRTSTKRRNPTMAKKKRTPAQRAAFRRMLAGLRAHKAGKGRRKKRGRKARARRTKTTTVVVATNPRRKRRKNSRGGSIMAKRRRRRTRTNPGRRHHRRRNPHRRHRRRNPGGGGLMTIVKSTIASAIPSMATGATLAIVDSKLFKDKALPVQVIGKLGLAAGAGYLLRGRPRTACLVMGAIMGGIGYQLAANAAGGVVAPDKQSTAKAMQALVYADRRMAALVNRDGSLRTQPSLSGMGQSMGDGGTALPTMPIYDPVNLG